MVYVLEHGSEADMSIDYCSFGGREGGRKGGREGTREKPGKGGRREGTREKPGNQLVVK